MDPSRPLEVTCFLLCTDHREELLDLPVGSQQQRMAKPLGGLQPGRVPEGGSEGPICAVSQAGWQCCDVGWEWRSAQPGKVPSWKMVCAQVFMAKLSSRTPIRFIRSPVRTCKGALEEAGFYWRPIIQMGKLRVRKSFTQYGTPGRDGGGAQTQDG